VFANITPGPFQAEFEHGVAWMEHGITAALSAHPNADLWLRPPAGAREIKWGFGIFPGAYARPEAGTNGVEFLVHAESPDGRVRRIYSRLLDPLRNPQDRGDQRAVIPYVPQPDEVLHFSTRPHENPAFDWAYWTDLEVN
jgi:hypothetical protein